MGEKQEDSALGLEGRPGRSGEECNFGCAEFEVLEGCPGRDVSGQLEMGFKFGGEDRLALDLEVIGVEVTGKHEGKSSRNTASLLPTASGNRCSHLPWECFLEDDLTECIQNLKKNLALAQDSICSLRN